MVVSCQLALVLLLEQLCIFFRQDGHCESTKHNDESNGKSDYLYYLGSLWCKQEWKKKQT